MLVVEAEERERGQQQVEQLEEEEEEEEEEASMTLGLRTTVSGTTSLVTLLRLFNAVTYVAELDADDDNILDVVLMSLISVVVVVLL